MCTHRSSQASYIDRIWFTESIIHHIYNIHPVIIMDFQVCWSTWNVARSRWGTPCEANHHQQPHPHHGGRQRRGWLEQWIYAGWMMLVFSEQQISHQHRCSWRSDCLDDIPLRQIVGACPRSRMRLKLRQLHSGNFQQYLILSYTYQIKINHGGQQQLQLDVLQQQLQSGLDLLAQKDGFELESPEKTSFGQQMLIEILDTRQLQNPSLHCVLDR